jgi:SAM-dependent methyltransferase
MGEIENIKMRYSKRANIKPGGRGAEYFDKNHHREKELKFAEILKLRFGDDFSKLKLMEIGAGTGNNLAFFIRSGFVPTNIWANELLAGRVTTLKENFPGIHLEPGDAARIEHRDEFDVVLQATVYTSILDDAFKQKLAGTMLRMTKPGGLILWYDFIFNNPNNKDVKGIGKQEIRQLFCTASSIKFSRVTLAPPIGRRVYGLYNLFNFAFPFLRTHVIAEIIK